jgi:hypothetical protein
VKRSYRDLFRISKKWLRLYPEICGLCFNRGKR